jgi:methionyl-tRNA synthetase
VNRALKFVSAKYDGSVPDGGDVPGPLSPEGDPDSAFIMEINTLMTAYLEAMDSVKLRLGLQTVMLLSARGNLYLQQSGLGNALHADDPKRCAQVVSRALNLIYILSAVVFPFMPATSTDILAQLNAPVRTVPSTLSHDILAGHTIGTPAHLFKKIDEKQAEVWRQKFGGAAPPAEEAAAALGAAKGPAGVSKKKAAAAKKAADKAAKIKDDAAKSGRVLELEAQIKAQGDVVRLLKGKGKEQLTVEELSNALAELLKLKAALTEEQARS